MIPYNEALNMILEEGGGTSLPTETVPLGAINGRILAENVVAPIANQPFDNSAMDGFALKAEDIAGASESDPVALEMVGHIAAGEKAPSKALRHKQCYEIMTGAPMPPGCNTVVPVEKTGRNDQDEILFKGQACTGDNIRRAGEDFKAGDTLFSKGDVLNATHAMVLATAGIGVVKVLQKPRVGVISTGLEVVDDLNEDLAPGQIYNSTGPYLRSVLPDYGVEPRFYGTVPDEATLYKEKMKTAIAEECEIMISTGAVSAGVHDFVPSVLKDMGAEIVFHKALIRPGKPILFARFPDGGPLVIGLPGNPVSSAAGLRFFAYPLIRALQDLPPEKPGRAVVTAGYQKRRAHLRYFLRGIARVNKQGIYNVEIPPAQQSFMVAPFIKSNVWVVAPEGMEVLERGAVADVYPLRPDTDQSQT